MNAADLRALPADAVRARACQDPITLRTARTVGNTLRQPTQMLRPQGDTPTTFDFMWARPPPDTSCDTPS